MKNLKLVGLSILIFTVMLVSRAYSEDMNMPMGMKHDNLQMPPKETPAEKEIPAAGVKVFKNIWECPMKDYSGGKTKNGNCPKCGMQLENKMVIRGLNKAEIGQEYICTVTGEKFKATKETKAAEYKRETYYFCCDTCPDQFAADPDKYIKNGGKKEK